MQKCLCSEYLSSRGITDETIKKYGLELDDRLCGLSIDTVKKRLGRKLPKGVNEVIWFPLLNAKGDIISWIARLLPNISDENGDEIRFLCPIGSGCVPYITRATYKLKNGKPVIITEGAPKV
jgi:hypothetical protein